MTPEQIEMVRTTFVEVMKIKVQAGRLFYDRLFTIAPETRPLFKGDIDVQGRKLMDTLAHAIGALKNGPALSAMLEGLGQRHAGYGVKDEHYDKVGEALLWTLEKGLGDAFTADVKGAWAALYGAVATTMKKAAAGQAARLAASA